eukprot:m.115730 g.115730  ORF g.115730 m.115730 type:complete len:373 (+) comp14214_c0_seq8:67-1185(+)
MSQFVEAGERLCVEYLRGKCKEKCVHGKEHREPDWKELIPPVPRDEEDPRYARSYDPNNTEQWLPFLEAYGYVVLRGVAGEDECDLVSSEYQNRVNALRHEKQARGGKLSGPDIDFRVPSLEAWATDNWPVKSKFLMKEPALGRQAFATRTSPRMHDVWSHVFGSRRLWSSVDAFGTMRATKQIPSLNTSTVEDRPDWEVALKPHWDCNPWRYQREVDKGRSRMYQGLVALVDSTEEVGGFCVVPGTSKHLPIWLARMPEPNGSGRLKSFHPTDSCFRERMQRVPVRKGDLVIWDTGSVHGNYRNTSSTTMRLCLYVRYMPADARSIDFDTRAPAAMLEKNRRVLPKNAFEGLSKDALQLLSLAPYEEGKSE